MDTSFVQRLSEGYLLADGAMGTLLYARGVEFDLCFDELNLSQPELVREVHEQYVAAGARLIETNTFGANGLHLAEHGLEDRVREINAAGARLARAVADAEGGVRVAGSVGPLGARLAPIGPLSPARARAAFAEQIRGLAEGGADVICIETMHDLAEALEALAAARTACDLPAVVLLTFDENGLTANGASPEEVVRRLEAAGADVIGANCSTGPAQMLDVVTRMAAVASVPLAAMPNAGLPSVAGGRYTYTSSPFYMAEAAADMVAAGVALVGGCCGTTPAHVAAMREAMAADGHEAPLLAFPEAEPEPEPSSRPTRGPTRLEAALGERFVVTVEVGPPKGSDFSALLPRLRTLRDCGYVDAIDVTDSPRAQARMSALATAALIQGQLGLETVLHMGCRHRNLVAIHSELLGAHALGVRNVFVVMGDVPAVGDYPDATVVRDITASGLMRLLSGFNEGVDAEGRPLDRPTSFFVGCAFNFGARDLEKELRVLDRKLEAGARFALTQPVYDPRTVEGVLDRLGGRFPIPVIVGMLPLWNGRHAAFLHHEVPGIEIPEPVLARMITAGDDGRAAGVAIAQDVLRALDGAVQGAYFMPPFGKYELVPEVMAAVRPPHAIAEEPIS